MTLADALEPRTLAAALEEGWLTWQADGALWTPERAHRIYKQIMAEFEAPEMNGDHQEELRQFVAKRKQEGGAPTDF
jgi:trimethylamine--corrinoid protein Co-methyltransferase